MNELKLPPAPPLPPEVRERVLAKVLAEMDNPRRRRGPLLAVAAAVVTTLAVTTSVALAGLDRTEIQPLLPSPAPVPTEQGWPLQPDSTGQIGQMDPYFLARCANAVQQTGHAADYPPVAEWKATFVMGTGALEPEVVINDSFACLLTPATVTVSRPSTATTPDVTVVTMSRGDLVVLNPKNRMVTIGTDPDKSRVIGGSGRPGGGERDVAPVTFVMTYAGEKPADMHVKVQDGPGGKVFYDGPVTGGPVPVEPPLVTFKDRPVPEPPDSPDVRALRTCIDKAPTHAYSNPELWTPVLRHDVPGSPKALVARVGDVAVGYCLLDAPTSSLPDFYRAFDGTQLKPLIRPDAARGIMGGSAIEGTVTALVRLPPGVVRARMSVQLLERQDAECTVSGEFAFCSLFTPNSVPGAAAARPSQVIVTTYTSMDPAAPGTVVTTH
jgi:hypothetical protein